MKRLRVLSSAGLCVSCLALGNTLYGATLIDEVFPSGYNRLNNNIAGGNMAIYQSRSGTTAGGGVGSLTFTGTSGSSQQYFGYFTDTGNHAVLGVGDQLTIRLTFSMSAMPADNTYALRFGLFDDAGTRQTADLASGGNTAAFANNPGYLFGLPLSSGITTANQLQFGYRTNLNINNILNSGIGGDYAQIGSNAGGTYAPLNTGNGNYTLTLGVSRPDSSSTILSTEIKDSNNTILNSGSVTQTSGTQNASFDWFAWRVGSATLGGTLTFSEIAVNIIQVPEPSSLALIGVTLLGLGLLRSRKV